MEKTQGKSLLTSKSEQELWCGAGGLTKQTNKQTKRDCRQQQTGRIDPVQSAIQILNSHRGSGTFYATFSLLNQRLDDMVVIKPTWDTSKFYPRVAGSLELFVWQESVIRWSKMRRQDVGNDQWLPNRPRQTGGRDLESFNQQLEQLEDEAVNNLQIKGINTWC